MSHKVLPFVVAFAMLSVGSPNNALADAMASSLYSIGLQDNSDPGIEVTVLMTVTPITDMSMGSSTASVTAAGFGLAVDATAQDPGGWAFAAGHLFVTFTFQNNGNAEATVDAVLAVNDVFSAFAADPLRDTAAAGYYGAGLGPSVSAPPSGGVGNGYDVSVNDVLPPGASRSHDFDISLFAEAHTKAATAQVPEPASATIWVLLGTGLAGFGWTRKRHRGRKAHP